MSLELIDASAEVLRLSVNDQIPSPFDQDNHYETVYQRVMEIQIEQCDTLHLLYKMGLSKFVHVAMANADFYRSYETGGHVSEPFPEILPDTEYYIASPTKGLRPLSVRLMSQDEAKYN
jgi:hypothetical protein